MELWQIMKWIFFLSILSYILCGPVVAYSAPIKTPSQLTERLLELRGGIWFMMSEDAWESNVRYWFKRYSLDFKEAGFDVIKIVPMNDTAPKRDADPFLYSWYLTVVARKMPN